MLGQWNMLQAKKKYLKVTSIIVGLILLLTLSSAQMAYAATELSYDDGSMEASQNPAQNAYRAVRFVLADFGFPSVVLRKTRFYVNNPAGGPGPQPVEIHILADDGSTDLITPIVVTPSTNWHWEEVDLPNIAISGSFYIAIKWSTNYGVPSIGIDSTAPSNRSYSGAPGSRTALTNDLMMRVQVDAGPYWDIEQKSAPIHTLNVPVGGKFSVDVWIRNIPGNGLDHFYFVVRWDPTMMALDSYQQTPNSKNWDRWTVGTGADYIYFDALTFGSDYITDDMPYLNLTFRCLRQGSSPVTLGDGFLGINRQDNDVHPPDFTLAIDQLSSVVGGELLTANKLTVLAPYLTLVGLFGAFSSIAYTLRRRK